jgi:DNA-3-methyladenine glycosylase I
MDNPIWDAGACPATYTKNTTTRNGNPVYDDATLWIPYSRNIPSRAQLDYDPNKRENFRKAFDNFDYKKIALYSEDKIQALLLDAGIIRDKLKC